MSKWIGYLPDFYAASPQIAALQGALEQQTEALWTAENGLIDQLDVNKATWGLSCWEASLGLDVDVSRPDAYRRTRILSKLRGQGTTTVAMIQNVAESFYNGQVAVEEQPEAYRFDIRFLSSIGVPPNLDDLSAALEESKAEGTALAAHEADQVKHLTAAERTAWNAKADGAATGAHISNTNNPHGVTAAQVGAVPLSGGTLTGNLDIAKTIASVVLRTGDSSNRLSGRLMKNANVEGTVDDGLYLTDYGADGSEATLKIQGGQQRLRIKLGGTDYAVYHEGSKPTPADVGITSGTTDLTAGSSSLASGTIYLVYE